MTAIPARWSHAVQVMSCPAAAIAAATLRCRPDMEVSLRRAAGSGRSKEGCDRSHASNRSRGNAGQK
jgi:hypothetical protein